MPLTPKQQAFVEAYSGNATDAARRAGYKGSDNVLAQQGKHNLTIPQIVKAIAAHQAPAKAARIASRVDRQAFWTSTMENSKVGIAHRLRAAELLGKSEADFTDKVDVQGSLSIAVVTPYPVKK